ncbi:MAG: VWA domain-containing protein [Bryobacteraceae bacterium]
MVLFLGLALAAMAQEPAQAPDGDTPTFQSGVNLVQVPVVVRDRDGHAVKGLHKEDFQLFDRGKLQDIVSFAETRPGEQTAPDRSQAGAGPAGGVVIPERFVAFLFDDVSIRDSADLTRIRDAATKQLAALQPGDRASVVTTSCRVLLDLTDDRAKLQEAVAQISFHAPGVCRVARTEVLQLVVLASVVRRMALVAGQRSVILISPGFAVGHDRTAEEAQVIDAAIRSKVRIDALDAGGAGGAAIGSFDPSSDRMPRMPQQYVPPPSDPVTLTELAHGTGGTYVAAGNDLDTGFRKLATPEAFYVLGFSPGEAKADGSFHELKVKLKDSHKLTVQARKGYYAGARQ